MDMEFEDKKPKNPLDLLPKSKMSLDTCKRSYNDTKLTTKNFFVTQLKEMFDREGFSLYKSHYKYSDNLKGRPDFINKNFMRGIVQRMDESRKYVFASIVLFEDTKELTGYWVLRGQNPLLEVFDDFLEDNEWEKIELTENNLKEFDEAFYGDEVNTRQMDKIILI